MHRTSTPGFMFTCRSRSALVVLAALSMLLGSCDFIRDFGFGSVRPECTPLPSVIAKARQPNDDDGPGDPPNHPPDPPPPPPTFVSIMDRFCGFDINGDGTLEINSLKPLFAQQEPFVGMPNGVAVVFVDPRLVTEDSSIGVSRIEMMLRLGQLRQDLFSDGYYAYFVRASVYAGARHQDGRTLLAMRRFLQQIRAHYPLRSTLLIGSFPDAAIVRSVLVKGTSTIDDPEQFETGSTPLANYVGDFLATDSELVTTRAEIVLADLDGNWEGLYRETLDSPGYALIPNLPSEDYPANNQVFQTETYRRTGQSFQDVFHIRDHNVRVTRHGGSIAIDLGSLAEPSPEASPADRQQPNRIARPEIAVGRINPRSIATMPFTEGSDIDGRQPLDASGTPQRLRFNSATFVKWRRDATLERRLVADYLGRAHRFRLQTHQLPLRIGSIRGPDDQLLAPARFNDLLRPAIGGSVDSTEADAVSLIGLTIWLKAPAVLRGIATHCDGVGCQVAGSASSRNIEIAAGAPTAAKRVWRWHHTEANGIHVLTPSFAQMTTDANSYFYRTLWQNGVLANSGQMFIVHDGCEVMRPTNSEDQPYNSSTYGQAGDQGKVANGESLMFYANGLGLMARNKVFNDTPAGFSKAINDSGGRFGYGWMGYFMADAVDPDLDERAVDPASPERRTRTFQRKRSYFWNIIGDPTLKLRY